MKGSLYRKFIFGFAAAAAAAFLVLTFVSGNLVSDMLIKRRVRAMTEQADVIAAAVTNGPDFMRSINSISSESLTLSSRVAGEDLWMVSPTGRITYDSAGKCAETLIPDFDPSGMKDYVTGTFSGLFPEEMISVMSPVTGGKSVIGYVFLHSPLSALQEERDRTLAIIYVSGLAVFLLCLSVLFIFHFAVYRPLKRINHGVTEYAQGNASYRIPVGESEDEMTYLAQSLNMMAEEKESLEKYQRDFISNVSHDFRSPLTSVRGFLEAILDGTIPAELHEKYIRRVIGETERLTKLTEEMLTLGNESKGMLHRKRFDINADIKNVCASYEDTCRRKDLSFELLFEEPREFVLADEEKINRVLYNLIDNAIKFSYEGSAITIATSVRQKKVYVTVKDHGEGIPRTSLKKIWDRFYKSDTSRGKDKKGNGIGLAIVKEIIAAHGENIDVVSTEKVGTAFTFSLPQAEE